MTKIKKEIYISRIDQNKTHCWTLRIHPRHPEGLSTTFTDKVYGSKKKALHAAIDTRDYFLKHLTKSLQALMKYHYFPKLNNSKGYTLEVRFRKYSVYECWTGKVYNKFTHRYTQKSFSLQKYTSAEAKKLARVWREAEVRKIRATARAKGLIQNASWIQK